MRLEHPCGSRSRRRLAKRQPLQWSASGFRSRTIILLFSRHELQPDLPSTTRHSGLAYISNIMADSANKEWLMLCLPSPPSQHAHVLHQVEMTQWPATNAAFMELLRKEYKARAPPSWPFGSLPPFWRRVISSYVRSQSNKYRSATAIAFRAMKADGSARLRLENPTWTQK